MVNETNRVSPIHRFGSDFFRYLPSKAIPGLIGLLAIPIITRLFKPEDYGNYVLVMAGVGVLSIILGSMWGDAAVRFFRIYERENKLGSFYSTMIKGTIACVMGLAIICFGILQIFRNIISLELYHLISIGILLYILSSMFNVFLSLLNAKQKATIYSLFSIWKGSAGLAFGVIMVLFLKRDVEGLLWGSIVSLVVVFPFLYRANFGGAPPKGTFSKFIAIEMVKYSSPLIISGLAGWILNLSDRYLLGLYRGTYEVGLYSASYVVADQSFTMISSPFMMVSYPLVVRMWESHGKNATEELVGILTRYYLLLGIPAAIGISVLSRRIVEVFTAPPYYEGYRIIPLVAFSAFLLGLQWLPQAGLTLYKRTSILMYSILSASLLNIGLNFLLVPKYGYLAAATTTLISYAFLLLVIIIITRGFFVWRFPFKSMAKMTCSAGIMGVVVYLIGNNLTSSPLTNLILGICSGIVVYFGMLSLLKETGWRDQLGKR